ncbi:hypothetical protein L2E82_26913 [Cichorium intybus]|uniref:Uncharacterized protein n=1 Tax=Cichorium intybus TaxID=13427 RepID=A0ACB9CRI7_CICIN|nr:hypothetical protein L2E82_26913 [Cichorium intybus]
MGGRRTCKDRRRRKGEREDGEVGLQGGVVVLSSQTFLTFWRFEKVMDVKVIEEELRKTSIGGRQLFARVARFSRKEEGRWKEEERVMVSKKMEGRFNASGSIRKPHISFAEAVKGTQLQEADGSNEQKTVAPGEVNQEVKVEDTVERSREFVESEDEVSDQFEESEDDHPEESSGEDDQSENFSGEEDERFSEESAVRETNFEATLVTDTHASPIGNNQTAGMANGKCGELQNLNSSFLEPNDEERVQGPNGEESPRSPAVGQVSNRVPLSPLTIKRSNQDIQGDNRNESELQLKLDSPLLEDPPVELNGVSENLKFLLMRTMEKVETRRIKKKGRARFLKDDSREVKSDKDGNFKDGCKIRQPIAFQVSIPP